MRGEVSGVSPPVFIAAAAAASPIYFIFLLLLLLLYFIVFNLCLYANVSCTHSSSPFSVRVISIFKDTLFRGAPHHSRKVSPLSRFTLLLILSEMIIYLLLPLCRHTADIFVAGIIITIIINNSRQ